MWVSLLRIILYWVKWVSIFFLTVSIQSVLNFYIWSFSNVMLNLNEFLFLISSNRWTWLWVIYWLFDNNCIGCMKALTSGEHRWELPGNYPYIYNYGNLPLWLENYTLFSLRSIFTNIFYTYPLRNIIYLGELSGNIISNYHGTFIHIFMHWYDPIYKNINETVVFFPDSYGRFFVLIF